MEVAGGPCSSRHDIRSAASVPFSSPSHSGSSMSFGLQPVSAANHQGVHCRTSFTRDHKEDHWSTSSLIFETLSGGQERRLPAPDNRFVKAEQIPNHSQIQDGVCLEHCCRNHGRFLGLHRRSPGCLLRGPDRGSFPMLSTFCDRRGGLRVHVPPLRAGSGPMGFHKGDSPHQGFLSQAGPVSSFVLGRLSSLELLPSESPGGHILPPGCFPSSRPACQLREVSVGSFPIGGVFGGSVRPGSPYPVSPTIKDPVHSATVQVLSGSVPHVPSPSGAPCGNPELRSQVCPSGYPSAQTAGVVAECLDFPFFQGFTSSSGPRLSGLSPGMVGRGLPPRFRSHVSARSFSPTHDGCLPPWLERGSSSLPRFRGLATVVQADIHQLAGAHGGQTLLGTFLPPLARSECASSFRQLHGCVLSPSTGDLQVPRPVVPFPGHSGVLPVSLHLSRSPTLERRAECPRRPALPQGPCRVGVVYGRGHLPVVVPSGRSVPSGPLRHQRQRSPTGICFSISGSESLGGRRILPPLGGLGFNLSLPTCEGLTQGCSSALALSRSRGACGSPLLSFGLVPSSSTEVPGSGSPPCITMPFPAFSRRAGLPPGSVRLHASRVETVRLALFASGWTEESVSMLLRAHKISTSRQYQAVWEKFLAYLSMRRLSAADVSVGVVCGFLCYHAVTLGRAYRTLSGYRSALRHPLLFAFQLDVNSAASDLFLRGIFHYAPSARAKSMPAWSLNMLLSSLLEPPFEPLESVSFYRLTQKTLCLFLLASGRRISDMGSLSRSARSAQSGRTLFLDWVRGYVPKNHTPDFQPSCPSIRRMTSVVLRDRLLCPVRAYEVFMRRSGDLLDDVPISRRHRYLWLNPQSLQPLSKGTLSKWFIDLVLESRRLNGLMEPVAVGPHQMRKFAASYSSMVGQDEECVVCVMGFASNKILRKNYVAQVPPLMVPCVLPGGPFLARRDHALSDSE